MLIPGFVSDTVGLLLFVPGLRTMAGIYLLKWVARKPSFTGFVNFSGSTFTQGNRNQNSYGFGEQSNRQNDFDNVIEGEFEERPDPQLNINQKKKDHRNDC